MSAACLDTERVISFCSGVPPMFQTIQCDVRGRSNIYQTVDISVETVMIIEVQTDSKGIDSTALRTLLDNWPTDKPKPKVLYTVPVSVVLETVQFEISLPV